MFLQKTVSKTVKRKSVKFRCLVTKEKWWVLRKHWNFWLRLGTKSTWSESGNDGKRGFKLNSGLPCESPVSTSDELAVISNIQVEIQWVTWPICFICYIFQTKNMFGFFLQITSSLYILDNLWRVKGIWIRGIGKYFDTLQHYSIDF